MPEPLPTPDQVRGHALGDMLGTWRTPQNPARQMAMVTLAQHMNTNIESDFRSRIMRDMKMLQRPLRV
jgi:hypothetical protein